MMHMQKSLESKPIQSGLVISYHGHSVAVETEHGQVFQCYLRRNQDQPVVGDYIQFKVEGNEQGQVVAIKPRRSLLARGDQRGKLKPIAANIDAIIIVMAPPPIFSEYLVDRYLIAAQLLNIPAGLVLNKTDLLNDDTYTQALDHLKPYHEVANPVILSSALTRQGLEELKKYLQNKAAVLVGPSGVGKSSIIAALSETPSIMTTAVSTKGAGKHTTTATKLYHLPQGGRLIDSPGVRDFNLWPVTANEILQGFKEFNDFLPACKFRDCSHVVEPGCAVQAAVKAGKISAKRYQNYQTLMKEFKRPT